MLTRNHYAFIVCVLFGTGCIESISSVAHEKFVHDTGCNVAEDSPDETSGQVEVSGCGQHVQYACAPGYATNHRGIVATSCTTRPRYAILSTDGAWQDDWEYNDVARAALMRSAAHDIPCANGSLTFVDNLIAEGCGQRVTYRDVSELAIEANDSKSGYPITNASKYVLVGRLSVTK